MTKGNGYNLLQRKFWLDSFSPTRAVKCCHMLRSSVVGSPAVGETKAQHDKVPSCSSWPCVKQKMIPKGLLQTELFHNSVKRSLSFSFTMNKFGLWFSQLSWKLHTLTNFNGNDYSVKYEKVLQHFKMFYSFNGITLTLSLW